MSDNAMYECPRHEAAFEKIASVLYPSLSPGSGMKNFAGDNDLASLSEEAASLILMYRKVTDRIEDEQVGLQELASQLATTLGSDTNAKSNFSQVAVVIKEAISEIGRMENLLKDARDKEAGLRSQIDRLERVLEARLMDKNDGASASDAYWEIAEVIKVPNGGSVIESAGLLREFHDRMAGIALKHDVIHHYDESRPVDELIEAFAERVRPSATQ